MRVYVAGPLSAETLEGVLEQVARAMEIGLILLKKGHVPFLPHLSFYWDRFATEIGCSVPYEDWLAYDREWLSHCDALYFIAPSPGACRERDWAEELGLTVYTRMADVPDAEDTDEICG